MEDSYNSLLEGDGVVLYMEMTINVWPKSWKIVCAQGDIDNDALVGFCFRLKSSHVAQWYYGNGNKAVTTEFDIGHYTKLNEKFEIILVLNKAKSLFVIINGKVVAFRRIFESIKDDSSLNTLIYYADNLYQNAKFIDCQIDNLVISNIQGVELEENQIKFQNNSILMASLNSYESQTAAAQSSVRVRLTIPIAVKDLRYYKLENDDVEVIEGGNYYKFLFKGNHRQFDYLTGRHTPSAISVENFCNNIMSRLAYCKQKNVKYVHVVYPSKPLVNRAFLPQYLAEDINSLYLEFYQKDAEAEHSCLLYPLHHLIQADLNSETLNTYRKNDTHMSDYGYLKVTEIVMSTLLQEKVIDLSSYFTPITEQVRADLSVMVRDKTKHTENTFSFNQTYKVFDNRKFIPSNSGNVVIYHNKHTTVDLTLLCFGDSFQKDALKFYLPFFKTVLYIRSQFFLKDIVELFNPDAVISSNTERYLAYVESDFKAISPIFSHMLTHYNTFDTDFKNAFTSVLSRKFYPHIYESWCQEQ